MNNKGKQYKSKIGTNIYKMVIILMDIFIEILKGIFYKNIHILERYLISILMRKIKIFKNIIIKLKKNGKTMLKINDYCYELVTINL